MKKNLIKSSLLYAFATMAYISLVALFMSNADKTLGNVKGMLAPIVFLTLLVMSAAITGSLVLGKPVMMYIDGQKKEAVKHFLLTIGWMFIVLVIGLIILIVR